MSKATVTEIDAQNGLYRVGGRLWKVGRKYKILEFLACGGYAEVCKAKVRGTSKLVAIKMMIEWKRHIWVAKHILREIYIMRRLSHPNILSLVDAFFSSPDEGGRSDLYIVSDFADKGCLHDLQGPVTPVLVKKLMKQLLEGVKYMHSCGVWHRDIKTGNVLLMSPMTVKICDFNHSRFAEEISGNKEQNNGTRSKKRRLTAPIGTRSYRAPELIMSHGEYTSAVDIWACACIFWQLLKASAPTSRTNYIFEQKLDEYVTPNDQESFLRDTNEMRRKLLHNLFNIIGTPTWYDIQSIPNPKWRQYLTNLPGRPGNLRKTLGSLDDDDAIDLLSRMLSFNPSNRCTAEEALTHQYFKKKHSKGSMQSKPISMHNITYPSSDIQIFEEGIQMSIANGIDMAYFVDLIEKEVHQQQEDNKVLKSKKEPIQSFENQPTISNTMKSPEVIRVVKRPRYM